MPILLFAYIVPILVSLFFFTDDPNLYTFTIVYSLIIILLLQGYKFGRYIANLALLILGCIILLMLFVTTFIEGWSNINLIQLGFIIRDIISFLFLWSVTPKKSNNQIINENGITEDSSSSGFFHNIKRDLKSPITWIIIAFIIYSVFLR
tara:strand:+ start:64 stop:513 length:450 start_codon:yes stop_codon:yes gene_type:complete